jgi:DNA-binding response OmpR family regulator
LKHALIIEDYDLIASMIRDELAERGYGSIETAASQEQAIEMAKAPCPDLITVDDKLASGTGIEAIREICRDRRYQWCSLPLTPARSPGRSQTRSSSPSHFHGRS